MGEKSGHPFRGNQFTSSKGGGKSGGGGGNFDNAARRARMVEKRVYDAGQKGSTAQERWANSELQRVREDVKFSRAQAKLDARIAHRVERAKVEAKDEVYGSKEHTARVAMLVSGVKAQLQREADFKASPAGQKARLVEKARKNASTRGIQQMRKQGFTGEVTGDAIVAAARGRIQKASTLRLERKLKRPNNTMVLGWSRKRG